MKIINCENFSGKFNKIDFEQLPDVREIIKDVKDNGDDAIKKYTKKFDNIDLEEFEISKSQIKSSYKKVDKETITAIKNSIKNVKGFCKKQLKCLKPLKTKIMGNDLGHKLIPLETVGCYIPGGNYPLLSSAIMTIIPAKIAGVKTITACSPKIQPETIVACDLSGADKIYQIGGVQAISAMAYGTKSILKVNKIVGPGNKYVTAAKKYVYGECGIDFLAGPSEVMIVADDNANPEFIAADMLAQCEHDIDACAVLVCFSMEFAQRVEDLAQQQLKKLKTKTIAAQSFENSVAIIINKIEDAVKLVNLKAPEHLEICINDYKKHINKFINYGSLFIGNYSAEVFGDYCSGTNHVLPTNEVAKYCGGLNVLDFLKIQTYQIINSNGAKKLAQTASVLAEKEGLYAHKLACDLRKFT